MTEAALFPDSTEIVIAVLATALTEPVHAQVPTPRPEAFVIVDRTGGPRLNVVSDGATIAVESWGPDNPTAHDLAQRARQALHAAQATTVAGHTIYRVVELSGPGRLPDPDSHQARWTQTFTVQVRGTAP